MDEGLFGINNLGTNGKKEQEAKKGLATNLSREATITLRDKTLQGQAKEAIIVPQSEIDRIKNNAKISTKEHVWADNVKLDQEKKTIAEKSKV